MEKNELIRRLTVLDTKCSCLLQLSAVVLALNMISSSFGKFDSLMKVMTTIITFIFLLTSFLLIMVIWVNWEATERTVKFRTRVYHLAVFSVAIGLILIGFMTYLLINPA